MDYIIKRILIVPTTIVAAIVSIIMSIATAILAIMASFFTIKAMRLLLSKESRDKLDDEDELLNDDNE